LETRDRVESKDLPVDGHVHFHRAGRVGPTLDAAAVNFGLVSGRSTGLVGAVLLVEAARENVFARMVEAGELGGWRFTPVAAEPQTLVAQSGDVQIAVVCGRQVRCARGLEVLALGTLARFPEGEPLEVTVDRVEAANALAAVPWGFGKWTGQRGAQVRELFQQRAPESLFVGDNGGRVELLGLPKLVRTARDAGFRVLPGTDPFPFGGDHRRVGGFGFTVQAEPDPRRPWSDLRASLEAGAGSPKAYGRALGPVRFAFNQIWIQAYNRMNAKATT
jgi:hypothetical protein